MIHNSSFAKNRESYFINQFNHLIFFFDSKLIFLVDFSKNKKCKEGLKYLARTNKFRKKGKLKLGKFKYCFNGIVMKTVDNRKS